MENGKDKICINQNQYTVKSLTHNLLDTYFKFFETKAFTDDSPYRCYCQIYQMPKEQEEAFNKVDPSEYGKACRDMAEEQIKRGILQGYLAFDGEEAIGWCNVNDKCGYTILSRDIKELDLQERGKERAVTCFEIAPEYRGKGIATLLLKYAVQDAKEKGFCAIEGYPDIREERYEWDCKGPLRLYEKVGFTEVSRHEKYLVMRKEL